MSIFQNFLMKQMLKKQLGTMPPEQQEKIIKAIEENPDMFKNIAEEIQIEMKLGKDQGAAALEVMKRHQKELQAIFTK